MSRMEMYGSKFLRRKCKNVTSENLNVYDYYNLLVSLCKENDKPYLTLQHVKHVKRGFVMRNNNGKGEYVFFINPKIIERSDETIKTDESFISYPRKVKTTIERSKKISIKYIDQDFVTKHEEFSGEYSIYVQQALDLFDGIIPLDYERDKKILLEKKNKLILGINNKKKKNIAFGSTTSSGYFSTSNFIPPRPSSTSTRNVEQQRGRRVEIVDPSEEGITEDEPIHEERNDQSTNESTDTTDTIDDSLSDSIFNSLSNDLYPNYSDEDGEAEGNGDNLN